ncbi:MAG: pilus assembly protein [Armatimonadetes bacterium]|nr:pilus assembly protein [Armatimonadota bacterium]
MTHRTRIRPRRDSPSSGTATVELALILPIVLLMLFGIIEMGLLFKDHLMNQQAVREGARAAALGATPAQISSAVSAAASTLDPSKLSIRSEYRVWSGTGWSGWMTLGTSNDGTANNAPPGAQIRVSSTYRHRLVTGALFRWMADEPQTNVIILRAAAICRRE